MQCNRMGYGCLYMYMQSYLMGLGDECSVTECVMGVLLRKCTAIFGAW